MDSKTLAYRPIASPSSPLGSMNVHLNLTSLQRMICMERVHVSYRQYYGLD